MKAGVSREVVEAELHRFRFEHWREKHPTRGHSFLEACDPGIVDLVDEFAVSGEGISRLLVDAAADGRVKLVDAMLKARANLSYRTSDDWTPLLRAV